MKFQPESLDNQFVVQRYDEEGVVISGRLQTESVVFGTDFTPEFGKTRARAHWNWPTASGYTRSALKAWKCC